MQFCPSFCQVLVFYKYASVFMQLFWPIIAGRDHHYLNHFCKLQSGCLFFFFSFFFLFVYSVYPQFDFVYISLSVMMPLLSLLLKVATFVGPKFLCLIKVLSDLQTYTKWPNKIQSMLEFKLHSISSLLHIINFALQFCSAQSAKIQVMQVLSKWATPYDKNTESDIERHAYQGNGGPASQPQPNTAANALILMMQMNNYISTAIATPFHHAIAAARYVLSLVV